MMLWLPEDSSYSMTIFSMSMKESLCHVVYKWTFNIGSQSSLVNHNKIMFSTPIYHKIIFVFPSAILLNCYLIRGFKVMA